MAGSILEECPNNIFPTIFDTLCSPPLISLSLNFLWEQPWTFSIFFLANSSINFKNFLAGIDEKITGLFILLEIL